MSLSKKIFIASSVLLAFFLIFWGIYNLAFKKPAVPQSATPANNAPTASPSSAATDKKISAVSDEAVLAPALMPDGQNIKYYSKSTGQAYQVALDGTNKKTVNTKELPGLVSVKWSPDGTKVISQINTDGKNRFYYYDYAKNQGIQLKDNLDTVSWQNNGKILYKYYDPKTKERSLDIADPDGSNWQKIADLDFRDVYLEPIPKTGLISYWNAPDAFTPTIFQSVPIIGGEKKILLQGKFGADYLWSPDGSQFLASSSVDKASSKISLAVANDRGGEYKNLEIPTLTSKCVWSRDNKTVYYALPGNIPENSVLPNDYWAGKFNTADTFWKVNTITGEKSRIIDLSGINGEYDTINLFLNFDESILFFINRADGKLYKMDL